MCKNCFKSKGSAKHQKVPPPSIPVTPRFLPAPEPEPQLQWNKEEIERRIDFCEVELKQLIATTETSPLPLCAQKPGISIYGKETARGFLMKSEWECPHSPEAVLAFIQNNTLRLTWDPNLAECRRVGDVNAQVRLLYECDNEQFVPCPRDFLYAGKTCSYNGDRLYVKVSVEIAAIPPIPGHVRAHLFVGGYHLRPTAPGTLVTLYSEMDFGGGTPNRLLVKASSTTLKAWIEAFNQGIARSGE